MKKAVVIDRKKISRLKKKIAEPSYMNRAIDQLAYEILWLFL